MLLTLDEIRTILKENLPKASDQEILRAADALSQAKGRWKEVNVADTIGAQLSVQCRDICALGEAYQKGTKIRAFIAEP